MWNGYRTGTRTRTDWVQNRYRTDSNGNGTLMERIPKVTNHKNGDNFLQNVKKRESGLRSSEHMLE